MDACGSRQKSFGGTVYRSYRILKRIVELPNDVKYTVSIDRLKPFVKISKRRLPLYESKDASDSRAENKNSSKDNDTVTASDHHVDKVVVTTRAGRRVSWKKR